LYKNIVTLPGVKMRISGGRERDYSIILFTTVRKVWKEMKSKR
jgi:hypothetical protein